MTPYVKAWHIEGYTYEADVHCVECTKARFREGPGQRDQHGVPEEVTDREGNVLRPIFAGDEAPDADEVCGTCGTLMRAALTSDQELS